MENEKLINWNYYVGKKFMELDTLARGIIRTLQFDWIMRPVDEKKNEYKFIWRFGTDKEGYLLEADMEETRKAYEIIKAGKINSKDVLPNLTSPFRICTDKLDENEGILGDYNG